MFHTALQVSFQDISISEFIRCYNNHEIYDDSFTKQKSFKATDQIDSLELTADPQTTTPNNCTCTSICRCAVDYSDCDPGNPISWWPKLNTEIGEVRDWCYTGRLFMI